jgi:APA family basic amino acid/polyamine antiporter
LANSKPPLDFASATTLVAASMIGVGVYTTSGYTLLALGDPWQVITAWVVGGVIAICGAIGYASLASRFTQSGGEYLFLSRTWHPVAGLMAGWVSLLAGFTGAIAAAALGLEQYLAPMLPEAQLPDRTLAIASVVVAAILHTIGVRTAARIQDLIVVLKLLMIVGFIVFAVTSTQNWEGLAEVTHPASPPPSSFNLLEFANQLVWISFSYLGFNAAIYVSGEVINPERNVPRAMIAGTVLVTFLYVVLNAIFVLAPAAAEIISEENRAQIAAIAAQVIGGPQFATFVRIVIVISLFTSVSAMVMTGPRVYAKMADDGFLPPWFSFRGPLPVRAIWFQALLAIVAICISSLQNLLGYLGMTLSLCSALTVSMLFVVRRRRPDIWMPAYGIPAAIYVVATLVLAVLYGIGKPESALAAVVTLLIGFVVYPVLKHRSRDVTEE